MYFDKFAVIYYNFNISGKEHYFTLRDITENVRIQSEVLNNVSLYDYYNILDGETPEIISEKFYGSPQYHWVIMIANKRYNYVQDFPLTANNLETFLTRKYGVGHEDDIHHYINSAGFIVDGSQAGAASVSNRNYEESVNESKRKIKIINKAVLPKLLKQFDELL